MRTLADRLAEMRAERGGPVPPRSAPSADNRAEILARWFGARLQVAPDTPEDDLVALARESSRVQAHIDGAEVSRTIVVPGKLVNFVI